MPVDPRSRPGRHRAILIFLLSEKWWYRVQPSQTQTANKLSHTKLWRPSSDTHPAFYCVPEAEVEKIVNRQGRL